MRAAAEAANAGESEARGLLTGVGGATGKTAAQSIGGVGAQSVGAAQGADAATSAKEPSAARPLSVLVAEGNELNAEILVGILSGAGFACSLAVDGKQAIGVFAASKPGSIDAILMDAHMPVMDGFEAARAIRALDRPDAQTVRIFACAASTFTEDVERARASGMDDFLPKPIDFNLMLEKLRSL